MLLDTQDLVGGKIDKLAVGKVVYAELEKTLAFGPIMCNIGGGKGSCERIRIINPTKIDTRVVFSVIPSVGDLAKATPAAPAAKGKTPAPAETPGRVSMLT